MTTIMLYIDVAERWHFLYRFLLRKVLTRGLRTLIATANEGEAERTDRYLWTAEAGGFLPHARIEDEAAVDSPVVIGIGEPAADFQADVLVWWQPEPPSFLGRFGHLIEIVQNQPHEKEAARKRYKFYKSHGYPVNLHIIGKKD